MTGGSAMIDPMIDPMIDALRKFAVSFMTGHDPSVCTQIMDPAYCLTIGRHVLAGRDDIYLPAVVKQLGMFPGLTMTVHDVIAAPGHAAFHFSEHGASGGAGGPVARWGGIALFQWNGTVFTSCVANEDYASRRRQVKSGISEPVPVAHIAPWDSPIGTPNAVAEAVVREWLHQPGCLTDPAVWFDDGHQADRDQLRLLVSGVEILDLFSCGSEVAYGAVHTLQGGAQEVFSTGIVRVTDGIVSGGVVVRDRTALAP
jgi:hypothetical protein